VLGKAKMNLDGGKIRSKKTGVILRIQRLARERLHDAEKWEKTVRLGKLCTNTKKTRREKREIQTPSKPLTLVCPRKQSQNPPSSAKLKRKGEDLEEKEREVRNALGLRNRDLPKKTVRCEV